ncbi:MAG: hypothetical protein AAF799_01720 [Myxococcota bacterium]
MPTSPRLALRCALPLLAGLGSACAMDLPISERIINERPLAMRVEVVDPFADPDAAVRAEALPVESIRAIPFIVDASEVLSPERIENELEPVWLACPLQPLQGIFACLSAQLPLTLDEIVECPPVDFAALESDEPPSMPAPCLVTGGTPAEPSMQVPIDFNFFLGGDIELTMIAHRPDAGDTTQCANDLLGQRELSPECMYAVQRASIGPDTAILRLAAENGLADEELLGTIPSEDEVPDADRHPRIQTFRVVITDEVDVTREDLERVLSEGESIEVARGDTVAVRAGQTLVIETTAPEEDLQTYLIPTDDDAYEERDEDYSGDWYRTWGTLLSTSSDDPVSFNTWTMVPGEQDDSLTELPPEGFATLYYVLADSRQGVDWWWFNVQVQ